ncbi:hypothetical protein C4D60_Mb04t06230 [Musa balbisiana]|uniref:Uncharacterized protein n=1 Tax=Musa balbisiana TaxID=52838 RepID=A0A4S8KA11_MUSBA|nr:hypothetical protein C4D60_Mb04t06230 [Musa balbisiana]
MTFTKGYSSLGKSGGGEGSLPTPPPSPLYDERAVRGRCPLLVPLLTRARRRQRKRRCSWAARSLRSPWNLEELPSITSVSDVNIYS